jgi:hypothetical protein
MFTVRTLVSDKLHILVFTTVIPKNSAMEMSSTIIGSLRLGWYFIASKVCVASRAVVVLVQGKCHRARSVSTGLTSVKEKIH